MISTKGVFEIVQALFEVSLIMSFELDRIKSMDRSSIYSVHGYIRQCQRLLPSDNAYYNLHGHQLIISAILLFFDEPECFEINNDTSFTFKHKQHKNYYHIIGKKTIKRGNTHKYSWKIETSESYKGRYGLIDVTPNIIHQPISNKCNMYRHKDVITVGSEEGGHYGSVFGEPIFKSFIAKSDIVTITLDYTTNTVIFESHKNNKTETIKLKENVNETKFIAECNYVDSIIKILS